MPKRAPKRVQPATKEELLSLIHKEIRLRTAVCSLNHIDVSLITDMSDLFMHLPKFNGDISQWDVSNVTTMESMFGHCAFEGDISQWNVGSVINMADMFMYSRFNGDISQWDVSNVRNMEHMFKHSHFNGDLSRWNVSNVQRMDGMFWDGLFDGNLVSWQYHSEADCASMFSLRQLDGWTHSYPTPAHWWAAEDGELSAKSAFYAYYHENKAMVECLGASCCARAVLLQCMWMQENLFGNGVGSEMVVNGSLFEPTSS